MFESLRARLLLWYSAIVVGVLASSLTAVCYLAWRARLASVDAALTERVASLATALHPMGGGAFDLVLPPPGAAAPGTLSIYHVLWTSNGQLIDQSDPDRSVPRPSTAGARSRSGQRELSAITPSGATILAGRSLDDVRAELWSLAATITTLTGLALALSLAGGRWLVARALAPVDRIGRTARAMVDGDLSARIPIARIDSEFGQLAQALNDAFDKMHASISRQQRFTADASHELRTPLSTLSTEFQWALGRPRELAEYRQSLETGLRAVARMQSVVQRLLTLAREDAGAPADRVDAVAVDEVVQRVVSDLEPLARGRHVTVSVTTDPVVVKGDADRLGEAITNVLVNAIQYNVEGGGVTVTLARDDHVASLVVADTGPGISEADLPHIFEPFYRADPSRRRDPGGAGLGLTVARAVIAGMGGQIGCASASTGTTITVRLPLIPAPSASPTSSSIADPGRRWS
jgi:signal transduction histidine kinase